MAVKASCTITLTCYRDTQSVTRYYKLQSSTATAPTVPTTNPPTGWTTTEPTYTNGSTNTLYTCELTLFTDGAFLYSAVSKSSSYEAAKAAYNKAVDAINGLATANTAINQNKEAIELRATKTEVEIIDRTVTGLAMDNLIANGYGELGNGDNFELWELDGTNVYENHPSFTYTDEATTINDAVPFPSCEIPIDISKSYEFSINMKGSKTERIYLGMREYDIDKNPMNVYYTYSHEATTTKLSKDLKNGDKVVYLESTANWNTSATESYNRGLIFWNYKDSTGYQYPAGVYSRNRWANLYTMDNVDKTNNTITLNSAWNRGTFPAGTEVSQSSSGSGYKYMIANSDLPTEWTNYTYTISGLSELYSFNKNTFNPAAKYVTFAIVHNYLGTEEVTTYINSVRFRDITLDERVDGAQTSADGAQDSADLVFAKVTTAESLIQQLAETISMLVTDNNGASLMEQTSTGWTFNMGEITNSLSDVSKSLNDLEHDVGNTNGTIQILENSVKDLGELANYVRISSDGDQPCIELGTLLSDFKLRITNTDIQFVEGSSVLAYFNNQSLHVKKAVIEEELMQGGFVWKKRANGNLGIYWKGVDS